MLIFGFLMADLLCRMYRGSESMTLKNDNLDNKHSAILPYAYYCPPNIFPLFSGSFRKHSWQLFQELDDYKECNDRQ